jgi:nitroreductase
MDVLNLIKKRRSIKRFKQDQLKREDLLSLIEAACFGHSVCNRQPIRYMIVMDSEKVDDIYDHSSLGFVDKGEAGLVKKEFAPTAYILISAAGSPSHIDYADAGAAFQNMALVGLQMNLGLFWIHAFAESALRKSLNLPEEQNTIAIIGVGRPAENPTAVSVAPGEEEQYYGASEKAHKVPKLQAKYLVSWR